MRIVVDLQGGPLWQKFRYARNTIGCKAAASRLVRGDVSVRAVVWLELFGWMQDLKREMDRVFRGLAPSMENEAWSPANNAQQCNGTLMVTVELPGLKNEEVS
jgi:hypothetical protein